MYVSPIKTQNYNIQNKSQNFKSLVSVPKASVKPLCGTFSNKITVQLSTIMKAYKEIKSKVTRLTPEGLAFIAENYPDITIGEGLTFHKCGENNSSILVRLAESFEYEGLARIIERKGNSTWSERIVLNSFLLEVPYKALKNEEANKQKLYPKERIYLTSEELKEQNYEQNLETVLDKLDTAMLFFRQYLRKIDDRFLTVPEGVLSGSILSTLKSINVLEESIEKSLLALPKNLRVDARKSYPNTKLITGLTSPAFNNDDVYITYQVVTPQGIDNMRRLNVFDAKGNIIDSYAVTTEGKMVSNLNKKFSTYFPKKISYFDVSQIKEEQNEPSFEKYLSIYHKELKALDIHIKDYLAKRLAIMENTPLELEQCIQNNISNILDLSQGISKKLKKISPSEVVELKKMVKGLYFPPGRRGITFDDFKGDKRVYFLKVNSRIHSNLCRMSIIDSAGNEKVFLIKDNKHVVKNYNPEYQLVIPKILKYYNEVDGNFDSEIAEALLFLKEKLVGYDSIVDEKLKFIDAKKSQIKNEECIRKFEFTESEGVTKEKAMILPSRIKADSEVQEKMAEKRRRQLFLESFMGLSKGARKNFKSTQEDFEKWLNDIQQTISQYFDFKK